MTAPTPIEALRELVRIARLRGNVGNWAYEQQADRALDLAEAALMFSAPQAEKAEEPDLTVAYMAGFERGKDAARAKIAAELAEPVAFWRSIVDRAAIQAGLPQRTRLHMLNRFDALAAAPQVNMQG